MDHLSQSGEQEVESSEGTTQEEEPEQIPRRDMEETQRERDHLSQSGEQEVESTEGTTQEEEPEQIPRRDMEETQTFAFSKLTQRARGMFKKQTLPA